MSRRNDDGLGCLFGFLAIFYIFKWLTDSAEELTLKELIWIIIVCLGICLVGIVSFAIINALA